MEGRYRLHVTEKVDVGDEAVCHTQPQSSKLDVRPLSLIPGSQVARGGLMNMWHYMPSQRRKIVVSMQRSLPREYKN